MQGVAVITASAVAIAPSVPAPEKSVQPPMHAAPAVELTARVSPIAPTADPISFVLGWVPNKYRDSAPLNACAKR
jgi:hypothetical protein